MKTKGLFYLIFATLAVSSFGQTVSTRTNDFEVDFSDPTRLVNTTIPVINWISPIPETNYVQDGKFKIKFEIESTTPVKNIIISPKFTA